jgi:hypothetical protein
MTTRPFDLARIALTALTALTAHTARTAGIARTGPSAHRGLHF